MIAVDTNVLVHAHNTKSPLHKTARARLQRLAEGDARWAIPVFCITEFARVVTHPRVMTRPLTTKGVAQAIEHLLASPSVEVLRPGDRFVALLLQAIAEGSMTGNLVFDAQIVALLREAGVSRLLTEDADFSRFKDLRIDRLE